MGFRLRKSTTIGGTKVTVSKSGISYSAGCKGFRATRKANGSVRITTTLPETGISYIEESSPSNIKSIDKAISKGKLITIFICIGISIIVLIAILCSYFKTAQHKQWIEEERARHTWQTDFSFVETPTMTYEYSSKHNGYRCIIKGSIMNQSGYDIASAKIIFGFYDKYDILLGNATTTIIDIDNTKTHKFQATTMEYFNEKAYVARVMDIEYSLIIN